MNPLKNLNRWLNALIHSSRAKREIDEELRFHIDQKAANYIANGMPPEEAQRQARKSFGNFDSTREECRAAKGIGFGETILQDVRFGLRMLLKDPVFSAVSVGTLALGVGATTAIYSVIDAVILDPIPGPEPDRVVQIAERTYTLGLFRDQNNKPTLYGVSRQVLEALLDHQNYFAKLAWCDYIWLDRKTEDFTESIICDAVPSRFFSLWNIPPLLGRTFAADESVQLNENRRPVRDSVVVLSFSMWQSHFGGDRNVIGRVLEMSGQHFTVVGVMPKWFAPEGVDGGCWIPTEPWHEPGNQPGLANTQVVARLSPGTTLAQVQAMLDTVASQLQVAHKEDPNGLEWKKRLGGLRITVRPLRAQFQGGYGSEDLRRTLLGLLAAISFVLLIVCTNIANLALARTERRQQELAIRSSIGAGRWRLARQLLTESVLLACIGGLAGIGLSVVGMKLLLSVVPDTMPRLKPIGLDIHALAYTMLISVVTGILFGVMPALRAAQLSNTLKQASIGATIGFGHGRFRGALIVLEMALAVVLLAGGGLMIKSVVRLLHVKPGFDPQNVVYVKLGLPEEKYNEYVNEHAPQLRKMLLSELQQRIQALPGIVSVGMGKHTVWPVKVRVEESNQNMEVGHEGCGVGAGDLFKALRVPLLAGRLLEERDRGPAGDTAVVNEAMARALWPGANALGKQFSEESSGATRTYQVIGVVGDMRDSSYLEQIRPTFYRPCDELGIFGLPVFLAIRTKVDPRPLVPGIRNELRMAEPDMRSPEIRIEGQQLFDSTQAQRTYMTYLVVFAAVGVLLCAIGIYGVLAYSVARRAREIGIRIAIGAQRGDVLRMVIGEGLRLSLAGVAVGLLAAFWLTRALQSQLFEVTSSDPYVMASVVVLLLGVALFACYLPGRRAARIDPMSALRYE